MKMIKEWLDVRGKKVDKDWIMTTERINNAHIELYKKRGKVGTRDKKGYENLSVETLTIFNKFYSISFIGRGGVCIELSYDEAIEA